MISAGRLALLCSIALSLASADERTRKLASRLPDNQKKTALRLGLAGAYVFRIVALFFRTIRCFRG